MKRIVFLIAVLVISLSSCVKAYDSIKPEDYSKYCKVITSYEESQTAFEYSPLSYNMIKGANPFSGYTVKIVRISTPRDMTTMYGDPSKILNTQYPDADLIVSYRNYFYVCFKNK